MCVLFIILKCGGSLVKEWASGESVEFAIGTSCVVLWTRRSQSSCISLLVWLAVLAYLVTYLTTRNSLELWNWHVQSDLQNHIVKACNSRFRRRNLQQKPDEWGTNLKNDLCQQAFISRGKHAESWVRALDGSRKDLEIQTLEVLVQNLTIYMAKTGFSALAIDWYQERKELFS